MNSPSQPDQSLAIDEIRKIQDLARMAHSYPTFVIQYARAREAQADAIFDECIDISDNAHNDWMIKHGVTVPDNEAIQRSRLRIDTRRWMAGKLRPKKYGDMVGREPVPEGGKESVVRVEGALPGEFEDDG